MEMEKVSAINTAAEVINDTLEKLESQVNVLHMMFGYVRFFDKESCDSMTEEDKKEYAAAVEALNYIDFIRYKLELL